MFSLFSNILLILQVDVCDNNADINSWSNSVRRATRALVSEQFLPKFNRLGKDKFSFTEVLEPIVKR